MIIKWVYLILLIFTSSLSMEDGDNQSQIALAYYGTINKLQDLKHSDTWYNRAIPWRREVHIREVHEIVEEFTDHLIKRTPPTRRILPSSLPEGISEGDLPRFSRRESYIELLLQAAQESRVDREKRLKKLTAISKIKIAFGVSTSLLGLTQLVYSSAEEAIKDDKTDEEMLANVSTAVAAILGGAYMAYEGISNTDAHIEVGKALQLEVLISSKYHELMGSPVVNHRAVDV